MTELSKDELRLLIEMGKAPCLSIYMPTHKAGAEVQQNAIRLKNLLKEAEDRLVKGGRRAAEVETLLEPAQALVKNNPFWRQQSSGLAIFLCPDFFRHYRLPVDFQPSIVLAERFHVKPLLPLFNTEGKFHVLALSQKDVRLLECFRYSVKEIRPDGMPSGIDELPKSDVYERQISAHTASVTATGAPRAAIFHGHGSSTDLSKESLNRFLQQIDRGIKAYLKEERSPLVFAGVDYIFAMFREANSYPNLFETGINGNPDQMSAEDLQALAWPIVEPWFHKEQDEARVRYRQSIGTGLASNNLEEIVPAAHHGRIGYLFVEVGQEKWGTFNPQTDKVVLHAGAKTGDEDLIDFAAIQTLGGGGKVYALDRDAMPDGEPVTALFRY